MPSFCRGGYRAPGAVGMTVFGVVPPEISIGERPSKKRPQQGSGFNDQGCVEAWHQAPTWPDPSGSVERDVAGMGALAPGAHGDSAVARSGRHGGQHHVQVLTQAAPRADRNPRQGPGHTSGVPGDDSAAPARCCFPADLSEPVGCWSRACRGIFRDACLRDACLLEV